MLEEKIEALTKEVIKLRQVIEAGGSVGAAASSDTPAATKPAAAGKKAAAPKKVEPQHDADEVGAIMRKAAKEVDKTAVQKYIKEVGCADLAELLTKPDLFDAAYAFAEGQLSPDEDEDAGDEEGDI